MKKRSNRSYRKRQQALSTFAYISGRHAQLAKDRKEAKKNLLSKEDK